MLSPTLASELIPETEAPSTEFAAPTNIALEAVPFIDTVARIEVAPETASFTKAAPEAAPSTEAATPTNVAPKATPSAQVATSSRDATQITSILTSLLPPLPLIVGTAEAASTSVISLPEPTTSSLLSVENLEIDALADDLLQYAIKDFFNFLEHCINMIVK